EANCVQCHTDPGWQHAPRVAAGRRLFFERACYTCHTIAGLSYGSIGPELTEVGRKRRFDYVLAKIENPRASNPTSTMPRQDLTAEQRMDLAIFLKAQQGGSISRAPLAQFVAGQQQRPEWLPVERIVGPDAERIRLLAPAAQGEALVPKVGCFSCHKLDGHDGGVGPDLAYTNSQRDQAWLMRHFEDPKSVVPGSVMPPYPLPREVFEALSAYLLGRTPPALPAGPAEQFAQLCSRCHGTAGKGDGVIAKYLDPQPRDLSKAAFMKTKTRDRLVASLMNGVPGTSMAPWGHVLGQQGAERLVDYVLTEVVKGAGPKLAHREIPGHNPVPYSAASVARGQATFLNRCWGCHGKKADGHGPNAEDIVPRPRNLRNGPFVRGVAYSRLHESIKYGVQGTAMPAAGFDFALDDAAIGDLINFIYSLNGLGESASAAKVAAIPSTSIPGNER
nr:c-type cytochrome [Thermoanaerobaculia bacterium]